LEKIDRIRVGGLKVLEGGACVVSSSPSGGNRLGEKICAPLALNRINLSLLAHVAGDREVLCTAAEAGESALSLLQFHAGPDSSLELHPGTIVLAVYPHSNRPEIIGQFIRSLARGRIKIQALASSPSAISTVLSSRRKKAAVGQLFEHFRFPSFDSPRDFFSAQGPPEEYVQKVVATYQEKVIKVYAIIPRPDLDLWGMSVPTADVLEGFADTLMDLAALGLSVPFLVAIPGLGGKEFLLSFSLTGPTPGADHGPEVRRLLKKHLPDSRPMRLTPVAGIFLHGPHFGDRYGIAYTLLQALAQARVTLLALSCTISSISLIIRQHELALAQMVLGKTFEAPVE
jgi:hypothetical protein